jgi:hypothetical protein
MVPVATPILVSLAWKAPFPVPSNCCGLFCRRLTKIFPNSPPCSLFQGSSLTFKIHPFMEDQRFSTICNVVATASAFTLEHLTAKAKRIWAQSVDNQALRLRIRYQGQS